MADDQRKQPSYSSGGVSRKQPSYYSGGVSEKDKLDEVRRNRENEWRKQQQDIRRKKEEERRQQQMRGGGRNDRREEERRKQQEEVVRKQRELELRRQQEIEMRRQREAETRKQREESMRQQREEKLREQREEDLRKQREVEQQEADLRRHRVGDSRSRSSGRDSRSRSSEEEEMRQKMNDKLHQMQEEQLRRQLEQEEELRKRREQEESVRTNDYSPRSDNRRRPGAGSSRESDDERRQLQEEQLRRQQAQEEQEEVKTAVDHNTTMIESMLHILQDIQCQNIKIEKRIGGLEFDMHSLRTKPNETSKRASPKEPNNKTVDKEFLKTSLSDMSVDVKSFVIKDNMAQLEKRLMTKLDGLKTSQGNTNRKVNQMTKEVHGLNETIHGDMHSLRTKSNDTSKRASQRVPNKRTHQEMEALTATAETSSTMVKNLPKQRGPVNGDECYFWRTTGCDYSSDCKWKHLPKSKGCDRKVWQKNKLSSEMKSQTSSLKSNQNTVEQVLTRELHALQDVAGQHTVELQHVKDLAQSQSAQLGTVASIVQTYEPYRSKVMLKGELKDKLKSLKEVIQTPSFLKRNDFSSDGDYGDYVKNNARVGMKVRFCYDIPVSSGLIKGDIGTVTVLHKDGLKADWSPKRVEKFYLFDVHELIA